MFTDGMLRAVALYEASLDGTVEESAGADQESTDTTQPTGVPAGGSATEEG